MTSNASSVVRSVVKTSHSDLAWWFIVYQQRTDDRDTLSQFYHNHSELIVKYTIGLKTLLHRAYWNLYLMVT